jgi:hypothetical protein
MEKGRGDQIRPSYLPSTDIPGPRAILTAGHRWKPSGKLATGPALQDLSLCAVTDGWGRADSFLSNDLARRWRKLAIDSMKFVAPPRPPCAYMGY